MANFEAGGKKRLIQSHKKIDLGFSLASSGRDLRNFAAFPSVSDPSGAHRVREREREKVERPRFGLTQPCKT